MSYQILKIAPHQTSQYLKREDRFRENKVFLIVFSIRSRDSEFLVLSIPSLETDEKNGTGPRNDY